MGKNQVLSKWTKNPYGKRWAVEIVYRSYVNDWHGVSRLGEKVEADRAVDEPWPNLGISYNNPNVSGSRPVVKQLYVTVTDPVTGELYEGRLNSTQDESERIRSEHIIPAV